MSENVIAFVPRPVELPVLPHCELYIDPATGGIQLVGFNKLGQRVVYTYALVSVSPEDTDPDLLPRSWDVWRQESNVAM